MASSFVYHTWVERLTNKSSTPDKFGQLCLKLLFLAPKQPKTPYIVVAGGLGASVGYKCTSKGPHDQTCDGVPGSPGFSPGGKFHFHHPGACCCGLILINFILHTSVEWEEVVVQTDNNHYALMVQCIRNKIKTWYVMTPTTDDLSDTVKKEVVGAIVKLGFDKKQATGIPYDKCPKGKS